MNKYMELKRKHEKEVNEFPMMFAFSNEQFEDGMKKLGVKSKNKLVSIGYGGFIRETDAEAYVKMVKRMDDEDREAMKDPQYCYEAFLYELGNHEYVITYDLEDTLNALGLTVKEVEENPMLIDALKRAEKDYLRRCD